MRLGIFAKTFPGTDPLAVLRAVRAAGYHCAQFNLVCAGLEPLPESVPDAAIDAIAAAAREAGVALVALSGTYNMIHPDAARRAHGLARLGTAIAAAAKLRIPLVSLCTGTRDPDDMWRAHPGNAAPEAWADLLAEMRQAAAVAERHGVDLGIEPEPGNVVTSAEDARLLFAQVGSPRLRAVLDPANLFERADAAEAARLMRHAVAALAGYIGIAHAKDRAVDGRVVPAGQGVVDFPGFLAALRDSGFDGPLIAHGLDAAEAPAVAAMLRRAGA
jgi:sugar phosphate isomerase/epimerase